MADQPSRERRPAERSGAVDDDLKRRLEEAYLNDAEDVLVVTAVRSVRGGDEVVVELRPPHGDATHTERFAGPKHGSLEECRELLDFLDAVGVSPLDLDDLVGRRVPANFDPETGWRLDDDYVPGPVDDGDDERPPRLETAWRESIDWLRTYRDWLIAIAFLGFELLLVVVLILRFA